MVLLFKMKGLKKKRKEQEISLAFRKFISTEVAKSLLLYIYIYIYICMYNLSVQISKD